ncbi:MAG: hypothetical protein ACE37J_15165 [Pikeienuella sp.]|uniref:head-tail connector protein n=1 Tax=Pikeienuella sp. TaxID=2831957 RepID=UPI00391DEFFC
MLIETSPPAVTPEMDAEIAAHLRLSSGFGLDRTTEARAAFRAAIANIEASIGLCLAPRGFVFRRRLSASTASVEAPISPVRSLTSVMRIPSDGGPAAALDLSLFTLEAGAGRTRIRSRIQFFDILEFTFDAGFGPEWADTPADLRRAALMLTGDMFDGRPDDEPARAPASIGALIAPWRPLRLSAGAR